MPLRFAEYGAETYRFPLTIRHLLDSAMITAGDQEIIYRDQARLTYRTFRDRIGRLASSLASLGVTEGTTVAVMDWDSHRYLEAYFAVPMMGAVLQTVNVRLPTEQVAYTLQHAGAEVVLIHHDFLPLYESVRSRLPGIKNVVVLLDSMSLELPSFAAGEYEDLLGKASAGFDFTDFDENALATTFYTSGTTGDPKGVCFSHRQIVLHTLAAIWPLSESFGVSGFGARDVYMPLTPMFHVHAWGVPYIATMLGLKQVYPGRYEPDLICQLRTEHGVTYSHCVPTILQMVLQAADTGNTDLTGWKVSIGGSALTSTLQAEGVRRGMQIVAGYGMSETAPIISIARSSFGSESAGETDVSELIMAGRPLPLVDIAVVDGDMNRLPHDGRSRGELVLRAPWLTPCYVGQPEASAALWKGGWLHTQDVATIDQRGNIQVRDRLKDVIKTGGEWIDSLQLEELLAAVEGVYEVSVIGVPDARWGERPLAVIVQKQGVTLTLDVLNRPVSRAIEAGAITRYAKLDRFRIVESLPRTAVGKIDKKLLRNEFA